MLNNTSFMNIQPIPLLFCYGIAAFAADSRLLNLQRQNPVFEPNRGQAPQEVLFTARDSRGTLGITRNGARFFLTRLEKRKPPVNAVIDLAFPGAKLQNPIPESETVSKTHILLGADESKWVRDLPNFAAVRFPQAYPGINLVFHPRTAIAEFNSESAPAP